MPPPPHRCQRRICAAIPALVVAAVAIAAAIALRTTSAFPNPPLSPPRHFMGVRRAHRRPSAFPPGAVNPSAVAVATAPLEAFNGNSSAGEEGGHDRIVAATSSSPISPPHRLEARLAKTMRETCRRFDMIEDGDHIMCCVSGGKDSATMLRLLMNLRERLDRPGRGGGTVFRLTAVHLDQGQPGYDNALLVSWLDSLGVPYRIVAEDTYAVVKEKTPESKTYCSLCSRLRRGVLYTVANELGCNKLALGHHGDDAVETLLLNAMHAGQLKAMPARYYSPDRDVHVIRPLIGCAEDDIREYATAMEFPILPCTLCGSQPDAQRARVKMLVGTLDAFGPSARINFVRALGDVRPSHLLDVGLREACGMDGATGVAVDLERARLVHGIIANDYVEKGGGNDGSDNGLTVEQELPSSFIESLL